MNELSAETRGAVSSLQNIAAMENPDPVWAVKLLAERLPAAILELAAQSQEKKARQCCDIDCQFDEATGKPENCEWQKPASSPAVGVPDAEGCAVCGVLAEEQGLHDALGKATQDRQKQKWEPADPKSKADRDFAARLNAPTPSQPEPQGEGEPVLRELDDAAKEVETWGKAYPHAFKAASLDDPCEVCGRPPYAHHRIETPQPEQEAEREPEDLDDDIESLRRKNDLLVAALEQSRAVPRLEESVATALNLMRGDMSIPFQSRLLAKAVLQVAGALDPAPEGEGE